MSKDYKILVINPGSISTKVALFSNEQLLFEKKIEHNNKELSNFKKIIDQYQFRQEIILNFLKEKGINLSTLDTVVGRGGLLKPIARISGMPEIPRISILHALNQKAVARKAALDLGKEYEKVNFIVAHLGGGISVGIHCKGKIIDVNNALNGEGPFTPERSGGVPVGDLANLCFSEKFTKDEIMKKIKGKGGLLAYLNTNDVREVIKGIEQGDKKAKLILKAMAYQVAKEIGAAATV